MPFVKVYINIISVISRVSWAKINIIGCISTLVIIHNPEVSLGIVSANSSLITIGKGNSHPKFIFRGNMRGLCNTSCT